MMEAGLPKRERLCGQQAVAALFEHGKTLSSGCLRCRYLYGEAASDTPRIVVSVPKRLFKRAVKRNLLKRRIRESYRRQKDLVPKGTDMLFVYTDREVQSYEAVYAAMTAILSALK